MDALLASSWYPSPLSFANTHLQSPNEGYSSIPFSLLVQEQAFTPSSPSLDMEAALEHLSGGCDSEVSGSPKSYDDPDVLMVDPFLHYLNGVLMEERDEEDVPSMRDDVEASYNAIMSSLYDIVREYVPLDSTSSEHISVFGTIQENGFDSSNPWEKSSHCELHADIPESNDALSKLTKESHILEVSSNSVPAFGEVDLCLEQENIGAFWAKQERVQKTSSQAHDGPLKIAHVSERVAAGAVSDFSFNNGGKLQDQEQTRKFGLLPLNYESPTEPSSIDILSLEEFKDRAGYADLYVGKPSPLDTSTNNGRARSLNGETKKSWRKAAHRGSPSARSLSAEVGGFVNLNELLMSCAQAVAIGDMKKASEILQELYQVHGASVKGNSLQRTAHYFCEALIARMVGYRDRMSCENVLPVVSLLKASRMWYEMTPYLKIMHYFANQNILKAAEGASRLHILDYGISYGMQWPCLINALADREGGPPLLVITGIDCSKSELNTLEWLEENGSRLAAYAKTYNVPFQFHAIVSDHWEDIDATSLYLQESEVLVINCVKRLRHHSDIESVDSNLTISPRQKLLMSMRSLNPHLLLTAELNSACNSPFFVSRFREALSYYSNLMNMNDTLCGDDPDRLISETRCFALNILNIVACEGAERVERPETYKQWDAHIKRAGFELLPIPSVILCRSRSHVKQHYHEEFIVHDDANGWMLLGWKGRTMFTMAAWKPSFNR